jgi:hypothetical protein
MGLYPDSLIEEVHPQFEEHKIKKANLFKKKMANHRKKNRAKMLTMNELSNRKNYGKDLKFR